MGLLENDWFRAAIQERNQVQGMLELWNFAFSGEKKKKKKKKEALKLRSVRKPLLRWYTFLF